MHKTATILLLNPIRTGMATTPEASEFTSIKERINQAFKGKPSQLLAFSDQLKHADRNEVETIPYNSTNTSSSLTGQAERYWITNEALFPRLFRLGVNENQWITHIQYFEKHFPTVSGCIDNMKHLATQTGRRWIKGMSQGFVPNTA